MNKVLVLDDDADLRLLLCEAVASLSGSECVAVRSFAELVTHEREALDCDVALLDVNLGANVPSGVDAFDWLRARDFKGRVVFLTGHARTHPLVERARRIAGVPVLEKPVALDTILSLIDGGS